MGQKVRVLLELGRFLVQAHYFNAGQYDYLVQVYLDNLHIYQARGSGLEGERDARLFVAQAMMLAGPEKES